jgi:hypothetical protein
VGAVLSFERERELIFLRWLSEVERLVVHQVDPDAAFKAWTKGYSAAEYVREVEWCGERERLIPRCGPCMDIFWVCENIRPSRGTALLLAAVAALVCPVQLATCLIPTIAHGCRQASSRMSMLTTESR